MRIEKYLLDGYVCGERKVIQVDEKEYEIQKYQGEHKNEYLISEMKDGKVEGRCELFENGILRLSWMMKDGQRIGRISEYEKGKALFKEGWNSVFGKGDHRMIENSKEGLKLVIRNKNSTVIFRGEFDEELNRHGKGIEYDENGKLKYEGYWNKDELMKIVREFEEDEMIEYEDCDNADVLNRIPLYVGGYNVIDGEFKRNGMGYLIDNKTGTAIRESEWLDGEELNGIDLFDGWYVNGMNESIRCVLNNEQPEEMIEDIANGKQINIHDAIELNDLEQNVTNLMKVSNCCNELTSLDLSKYKQLEVIEIGNDCFENVDTFRIDGLDHLKSLKIRKNSFTHLKSSNNWNDKAGNSSRSFHLLNCSQLESIQIGSFSFSDYGGGFDLANLPSLYSIKMGELGSDSYNFYFSSFVLKGMNIAIDDE